MKNLVKLMFVLQLIIVVLSSPSSPPPKEILDETETDELSSSALPNIWDDEVVSKMVREVLARGLLKDHEQQQMKRQHKREVSSTISPIETMRGSTTRKASAAATQKAKKPTKVTTTGNKNKNRVTSSTTATKATVKPSTKPIALNVAPNISSNNSSKVKVRTKNFWWWHFVIHSRHGLFRWFSLA